MTAAIASPAQQRREQPEVVAARHHIVALDGLRGVAIVAVILHHVYGREFRGIPVLDSVFRLLNAGWIGVDLFFVLSGFLITGILLDGRHERGYFRNFYARRTLRIFPLYYGCAFLAFVVLRGAPWVQPGGYAELLERQGWVWSYGTNIYVSITGRWGPVAGYLHFGHFWSLAVEEHFYLVWPLVVYWLSPRRLAWACVAIAACALVARLVVVYGYGDVLTPYVLTPLRADGLALGGLCATLLRDPRHAPMVARAARLLLIPAGAGVVLLFAGTGLVNNSRAAISFGTTVLALLFASVVVIVARAPDSGRGVRVLRSKLLRFFGKYSYGLYALHPFVLGIMIDDAAVRDAFARGFRSQTLGGLVLGLVVIVISIGLAMASWHLYEKHFLKLKRHFQ